LDDPGQFIFLDSNPVRLLEFHQFGINAQKPGDRPGGLPGIEDPRLASRRAPTFPRRNPLPRDVDSSKRSPVAGSPSAGARIIELGPSARPNRSPGSCAGTGSRRPTPNTISPTGIVTPPYRSSGASSPRPTGRPRFHKNLFAFQIERPRSCSGNRFGSAAAVKPPG